MIAVPNNTLYNCFHSYIFRKRINNWDKAPPGYEGMNVAQVASINPSVLMPLIAPPVTLQTRQSRRLYVGNLPPQVIDVRSPHTQTLARPLTLVSQRHSVSATTML